MGFGFLNGFCSNSSKDSEFGFEALSVVGAVDARTRQLGWRVGGVGVWVEIRHARLRAALGRTG